MLCQWGYSGMMFKNKKKPEKKKLKKIIITISMGVHRKENIYKKIKNRKNIIKNP